MSDYLILRSLSLIEENNTDREKLLVDEYFSIDDQKYNLIIVSHEKSINHNFKSICLYASYDIHNFPIFDIDYDRTNNKVSFEIAPFITNGFHEEEEELNINLPNLTDYDDTELLYKYGKQFRDDVLIKNKDFHPFIFPILNTFIEGHKGIVDKTL